MDKWYDEYQSIDNNYKRDLEEEFKRASELLSKLNIDIINYKIYGVSHLYTLWNLAVYCINNSIDIIS